MLLLLLLLLYRLFLLLYIIMRKLENWESVMHLLEASEEGRGEADEMQNKN